MKHVSKYEVTLPDIALIFDEDTLPLKDRVVSIATQYRKGAIGVNNPTHMEVVTDVMKALDKEGFRFIGNTEIKAKGKVETKIQILGMTEE